MVSTISRSKCPIAIFNKSGLWYHVPNRHGAAQEVIKGTGRRMHRTGKSFGTIGFMFAGAECLLEDYRGEYGLTNSVGAGCITGGLMGLRAGIQPAVFGCASFGAFSLVIDHFFKGSL